MVAHSFNNDRGRQTATFQTAIEFRYNNDWDPFQAPQPLANRYRPTRQPLHTVLGFVSPTTTKRPAWPGSRHFQTYTDPMDLNELSDSCNSPPSEKEAREDLLLPAVIVYVLIASSSVSVRFISQNSKSRTVFTIIVIVGASFILSRPRRSLC